MKRKEQNGFSLLEAIAAFVILTVVSVAAVATVGPMRARSNETIENQELAILNAQSRAYYATEGHYPDSVYTLANAGYLPNGTREDKVRVNSLGQSYRCTRGTGVFAKE